MYKLSQFKFDLTFLGNKISMSGCIGTFRRNRLKEAKRVFMIAAGTGKFFLEFCTVHIN